MNFASCMHGMHDDGRKSKGYGGPTTYRWGLVLRSPAADAIRSQRAAHPEDQKNGVRAKPSNEPLLDSEKNKRNKMSDTLARELVTSDRAELTG